VSTLTVAACQVAPRPGRPDDTSVVEAAVREAAAAGAKLVVLPELAVTGNAFRHLVGDRAATEALEGPTVTVLRSLSAELGVVIVCGIPEREGEVWWNAAVVVEAGELVGHYRKVHLWGSEKSWFAPADAPPLVVDTTVGRLGVMVCYDLEFPEWARRAADEGAEVLAVPVNWPRNEHPGQHPIEVAKAQAVAAAYGVHVVIADRCGVEDGIDWEGGSLVCGPDGYLLAGPATSPGDIARPTVVLAEVDPDCARDKTRGQFNDLVADRRPELYDPA
jgi:predicted amidohydrolase